MWRWHGGHRVEHFRDHTEGLDNFEDPQARFILGETGGIRIASAYIPNGKEVGSDKHEYKLKWLAALRNHLDRLEDPQSDLAILGDWNCAPRDTDAKNIDKWRDSVLCHDSVREAIQHVRDFGLMDPHEAIEAEGRKLPWGRLGLPEDIGKAATFLSSSESDYITGAVLPVDGLFRFKDCRVEGLIPLRES